jgi:hypothetical protein
MTQREFEHESRTTKTGVYGTPGEQHTDQPYRTDLPYRNDQDVIVTTPKDLIRWGPVIAGLLAALATLITLSVLGLAIGATTTDGTVRNLGFGTGIWAALTALVAFFVGGLLAARTAAVRGHSNGLLNGAMVWFVAIPLLVYLLTSGIGTFARTAAAIAAPVASQFIGTPASDEALQLPGQAGETTPSEVVPQDLTSEQIARASEIVSRGAWGTLLSLGLTAAAALVGGYLGARSRVPHRTVREAHT